MRASRTSPILLVALTCAQAARPLDAEAAPAVAAPAVAAAPPAPAAPATSAELLTALDRALGGERPPRRGVERALTALRERLIAAEATTAASAQGTAHTAALPQAELRCALGILHAHLAELARAQLHLAACEQPAVTAALRERGEAAQRTVDKALRHSALAPVEVATTPPGWIVVIEEFPEAAFLTPRTVWLPDGTHRLRLAPTAQALAQPAQREVRELVTRDRAHGSVFVTAPARPSATPGLTKVDLGDETVLETPHVGPPPPEPHRSILPVRYQRGVQATAELEGPAARRGALTAQLGLGRWQPSGGPSATATRLALHGHSAVTAHLAVELGLDWLHRFATDPSAAMTGSGSGDSANAFGAVLGGRLGLWQPLGLSLLAALHGRFEVATQAASGAGTRLRGGALLQLEARPIARWPLLLGAALELDRGQRGGAAFAAMELWTR